MDCPGQIVSADRYNNRARFDIDSYSQVKSRACSVGRSLCENEMLRPKSFLVHVKVYASEIMPTDNNQISRQVLLIIVKAIIYSKWLSQL